MEETNGSTEVDVKAGPVAFRAKSKYMAELVAAGSLMAMILLGYVLYQHDQQTVSAFKDIAATNKEIVSEMRMQTCLGALNEAERKAEYTSPFGFCKRMTR